MKRRKARQTVSPAPRMEKLEVTLTPEEKARVRDGARADGISMGEWARQRMFWEVDNNDEEGGDRRMNTEESTQGFDCETQGMKDVKEQARAVASKALDLASKSMDGLGSGNQQAAMMFLAIAEAAARIATNPML